jgi:hypothetical protein
MFHTSPRKRRVAAQVNAVPAEVEDGHAQSVRAAVTRRLELHMVSRALKGAVKHARHLRCGVRRVGRFEPGNCPDCVVDVSREGVAPVLEELGAQPPKVREVLLVQWKGEIQFVQVATERLI